MNKKNTYFSVLFFGLILNVQSNNIDKLQIPEGFEINIYAENIESPRQITETEDGFIIVGSKNGKSIYALNDIDNDGFAEEKILIANGLQNPTGVTVHKGDLYFSEIDKIWTIKNIDNWLNNPSELPKKEVLSIVRAFS